MEQSEGSTLPSQKIYLGNLVSNLDGKMASYAFASKSKAIFGESNQTTLVPLEKDFVKAHFI